MKYNYICQFCGGIAFSLKRMPSIGDDCLAKDVLFKDGTSPNKGDDIVCQECKANIGVPLVTQIK